jgi:hypothetical protein
MTAAVSRFEYNLLRLARGLLDSGPPEALGTLVYAETAAPPCLSRECVRLLQDTLAKGVVGRLVRAGGWRRERFLRTDGPATGRAWERTQLPERALAFGGHSVRFLMWLTAHKPVGPKADGWDAPLHELTAADEVFLGLAFDALKPLLDVTPVLANRPVFRANRLAWLLGPAEFVGTVAVQPPPFDGWASGLPACVLECLQPLLASRWAAAERGKTQVGDWHRLRRQGEAEAATLANFLGECERAGRPDLARFLLPVVRDSLAGDPAPDRWAGGLQGVGPPRLADRLATRRAALAVPAQVATLQKWNRQAQAVGYFDDGYEGSQVWKADWEAAGGDALAVKAAAVLASVEPLAGPTGGQP